MARNPQIEWNADVAGKNLILRRLSSLTILLSAIVVLGCTPGNGPDNSKGVADSINSNIGHISKPTPGKSPLSPQPVNVVRARYSPDGKFIFTIESDGYHSVWDATKNQDERIEARPTYSERKTGVAGPDGDLTVIGDHVVTFGVGASARNWKTGALIWKRDWQDFRDRCSPRSFATNNGELVVVSGTVQIVESQTGRTIRKFELAFVPGLSAVSPDGKWLLALEPGKYTHLGTLQLISLETGKSVHTFDEHEPRFQELFIHRDGKRAIGLNSKAVYYLDLERKKVIERIATTKIGRVNAIDSDFRRIAMVAKSEVAIWDIEKRAVVDHFLHGDDMHVHEASFSPDGHSLMLAGGRIWPGREKPPARINSNEWLENRAIVLYDLKKNALLRTIVYPRKR